MNTAHAVFSRIEQSSEENPGNNPVLPAPDFKSLPVVVPYSTQNKYSTVVHGRSKGSEFPLMGPMVRRCLVHDALDEEHDREASEEGSSDDVFSSRRQVSSEEKGRDATTVHR